MNDEAQPTPQDPESNGGNGQGKTYHVELSGQDLVTLLRQMSLTLAQLHQALGLGMRDKPVPVEFVGMMKTISNSINAVQRLLFPEHKEKLEQAQPRIIRPTGGMPPIQRGS